MTIGTITNTVHSASVVSLEDASKIDGSRGPLVFDQMDKLVSILIVNYNGRNLLSECLPSVLATAHAKFEIILVDNGSRDGSMEFVQKKFGHSNQIKIVQLSSNIGVTKAFNAGVEKCRGDFIVSLNNDTVVEPNWLEELISVLSSNVDVGAAQCKLLSYDDRNLIDSMGCQLDFCGHAFEKGYRQPDVNKDERPIEIFSAGMPASIYRRDVLDKVGPMDPEFFAGYEDADLCWRIRLHGYRILTVPTSIVYHKRSSTSGSPSPLRIYVSWNFSKNWIAMLLKNYSISSLVKISHRVIFGATLSCFGYLFFGRREMRLTGLKALIWNFQHLKDLMIKRGIVQNRVRTVSDNDIRRSMKSGCLLLQNYHSYRNLLAGQRL